MTCLVQVLSIETLNQGPERNNYEGICNIAFGNFRQFRIVGLQPSHSAFET